MDIYIGFDFFLFECVVEIDKSRAHYNERWKIDILFFHPPQKPERHRCTRASPSQWPRTTTTCWKCCSSATAMWASTRSWPAWRTAPMRASWAAAAAIVSCFVNTNKQLIIYYVPPPKFTNSLQNHDNPAGRQTRETTDLGHIRTGSFLHHHSVVFARCPGHYFGVWYHQQMELRRTGPMAEGSGRGRIFGIKKQRMDKLSSIFLGVV